MKKWIVLAAVAAALPTLSYAQDAGLFQVEKKVAFFDSSMGLLNTPDSKPTELDSRHEQDRAKIDKLLDASATSSSSTLTKERACVSQAIGLVSANLENIKNRSDYKSVAADYGKCGSISDEKFLMIAAAGIGFNARLQDITNVRIWVGKGKENGDLAGQISMTAYTPDFRYSPVGDDANCSNLKNGLTHIDFNKIGDTVVALIKRDADKCTPIDSSTDDSGSSDSSSSDDSGSSSGAAR